MQSIQISELDQARFDREGYLVVPSMVSLERCGSLKAIAASHLSELIAPVEYEVDVNYPGAPIDEHAPGASTSRRLLQAYARHGEFRDWATSDAVRTILQGLFAKYQTKSNAYGRVQIPAESRSEDQAIKLSQCHHNCVMTKAPGFSSATLWHEDNRYWSFDSESLISVWLALGAENKKNGCLRVIPGSHQLQLEPGRFDAAKFLRPDLPENKALISKAISVELNPGDVLFFHSKLFHAAGRNLTDQTKFSVVFTYHEAGNRPIAGTRSAKFPSIGL